LKPRNHRQAAVGDQGSDQLFGSLHDAVVR
jgi:hypothetical protein